MFDCWENGKFDREPVILRTITSVILDDELATCLIRNIFFLLICDHEKITKNLIKVTTGDLKLVEFYRI